jgi:hypothetical protein
VRSLTRFRRGISRKGAKPQRRRALRGHTAPRVVSRNLVRKCLTNRTGISAVWRSRRGLPVSKSAIMEVAPGALALFQQTSQTAYDLGGQVPATIEGMPPPATMPARRIRGPYHERQQPHLRKSDREYSLDLRPASKDGRTSGVFFPSNLLATAQSCCHERADYGTRA